jgi:hypothetical protein
MMEVGNEEAFFGRADHRFSAWGGGGYAAPRRWPGHNAPLSGGASAVLNVTTGDHAAEWGVVFRMTQSSNVGQQTILAYGEGDSSLQKLFDYNNSQSQNVWSQSAQDITNRANAGN